MRRNNDWGWMQNDARVSEPILYCRQLVTVILANERLAARHLRERYDLSYGEHCCLQALAGRTVGGRAPKVWPGF